jgi:hypothetical protein
VGNLAQASGFGLIVGDAPGARDVDMRLRPEDAIRAVPAAGRS